MRDLSVIIASRNEEFLQTTIDNVLQNAKLDTEVIVVLDGYWPENPILIDDNITVLHYPESIGQRGAYNKGVRASTAKYVMKLDAHCAVGESFDEKLIADTQPDWTVVPRMYNLHAFDWACTNCSNRIYQGPKIDCSECGSDMQKDILWKPRRSPVDYMWFNPDMKFSYFDSTHVKPFIDDMTKISEMKKKYHHKYRDWAQGDVTDLMTCLGACWFMERERHFELGELDENHGGWGQLGVEIACKSWLSGGALKVNKNTWFAHMFRTQNGFGFPYPLSGKQTAAARKYSRKIWKQDKWPQAVRSLKWMINHFGPLPGWDKIELKDTKHEKVEVKSLTITPELVTKGLIYYTDNRCEERVASVVRERLKAMFNGLVPKPYELTSVSHFPVDFGTNIVMPKSERSILTQNYQILAGLEANKSDIVFFIEHDILYHPNHFDFIPLKKDVFYYNQNRWPVCARTGQALFYYTKPLSHCCSYREIAIECFKNRIKYIEDNGGRYRTDMGHGPGSNKGLYGSYETAVWFSENPNVDVRHATNYTKNRFKIEQFRRKPKVFNLTDGIPGWGKTKGRFDDFLYDVSKNNLKQDYKNAD